MEALTHQPQNAVVIREQFGSLDAVGRKQAVDDMLNKVALVMEVMDRVMKDGEHYGKIPGCGEKKVLLKAGAEKLGMTFRFRPQFDVLEKELPNSHREYRICCTLSDGTQGVGSCSTMETKYRFRSGPKKVTDKPVPKAYWDTRQTDPIKAQQLIGGKGFSVAKNEAGLWMISEQGERAEHDNPADFYNTCLKMAKKRAHVDAVITATACSDLFTQDIDEMMEQADNTAPAAAKLVTQTQPTQRQPHPAAMEPALSDMGTIPPEDDLPFDQCETQKPAGQPKQLVQVPREPSDNDGFTGEEWRSFPMPFGNLKGTALEELDKKYLYGHWANFVVQTEYQGKPNTPQKIATDKAFRAALDAAGEHYNFKK